MAPASAIPRSVDSFLRAGPDRFSDWVLHRQSHLLVFCVVCTIVGAGSYGAAVGCWRSPLQAVYTGIKLPLVMLLTTAGNGLLNGMLAPLLGLNATFRQSLAAVLISFAMTSIVLGGLSPVLLFIVWNLPPHNAGTTASSPEYGFLQLSLTFFIALAGVIGNVRMFPLLRCWSGNRGVALKVVFAWLAGNLFLGSQISWVLRPFIGDATRPEEFIGPQGWQGSFFESVCQIAWRLLTQ